MLLLKTFILARNTIIVLLRNVLSFQHLRAVRQDKLYEGLDVN